MPWKPGESGNPAGRPPGLGDVGRLRSELYSRLPEVLESVVRAAKNGDIQAARLILERTVPALRPEELPVALDGFSGNRTELVAAVVKAIAEGRLDTNRGGHLISLLEPTQLDERISRVERRYSEASDEC
jgi:hypothetical protein